MDYPEVEKELFKLVKKPVPAGLKAKVLKALHNPVAQAAVLGAGMGGALTGGAQLVDALSPGVPIYHTGLKQAITPEALKYAEEKHKTVVVHPKATEVRATAGTVVVPSELAAYALKDPRAKAALSREVMLAANYAPSSALTQFLANMGIGAAGGALGGLVYRAGSSEANREILEKNLFLQRIRSLMGKEDWEKATSKGGRMIKRFAPATDKETAEEYKKLSLLGLGGAFGGLGLAGILKALMHRSPAKTTDIVLRRKTTPNT